MVCDFSFARLNLVLVGTDASRIFSSVGMKRPTRMRTLVGILLLVLGTFPLLFAQNANLWVDGGHGSCTRSGTLAAYNSATACASMQAAQTAASGGDTVIIKNGTYGAQSLSSGGKSTAVSFYAETPSTCQGQDNILTTCTGTVQLNANATALANADALAISIDHVHIYGVVSAGSGETRGGLDIENHSGTDILVDGFAGKNFYAASSGTTIQHSEFGNFNACNGYSGSGCSAGSDCATEDGGRFWGDPAPSNDTLLDSVIHDVSAPPDGVCGGGPGIPHVDALQIYQSTGTSNNIVIDGNKFYGNATSGMQVGGGSISNYTIQNNYYGQTACCNNLVWGQANCSGYYIVRNNTMANANGYAVVNNASCSGTVTPDFSGNLFIVSASPAGVAAGSIAGGYNIFPSSGGSTYGTNAKRCNPTFLNGIPSSANGYDIRLSSSDSCAKDGGNPSDYATTDMYGTPRPQGPAPYAGAFEFPNAGPSPPTALTVIVH
jgi:hypothetical protein